MRWRGRDVDPRRHNRSSRRGRRAWVGILPRSAAGRWKLKGQGVESLIRRSLPHRSPRLSFMIISVRIRVVPMPPRMRFNSAPRCRPPTLAARSSELRPWPRTATPQLSPLCARLRWRRCWTTTALELRPYAAQNSNRRPNCHWRITASWKILVILPAVPGQSTHPFGLARFTVFRMLNASARNCARNPSVTLEVLEERHIQLRERRTEQPVAPDAPESAAFGTPPGAERLAVGGQRSHAPVRRQRRGDEPGLRGLIVRLPLAHQIRAAPAGVAVGVAVTVAWRERQSALPRVDGRQLPAADDRIAERRPRRSDICGQCRTEAPTRR